MSLGCSWGGAAPAKNHPEYGLGQADRDRQKEVAGSQMQVQGEKQGMHVCSGELHRAADSAGAELGLQRRGKTLSHS